jgi:dipeptidyl aminopeptidase/acylaminoacyl peptidase
LAWISASPDYTRLITGELTDVPLLGEIPPAPLATSAAASSPNEPKSSEGLPGRLVFATSSGGTLYLSNADGSGLRHLADGVIDPVVSPNGRQVAFTRWDGAEVGTLYTLNLDDGRERVIMGDTLQAKSPTWSPDGTKIALSFQYGGLRNPEEECREFDFDDTVRIPTRARVTSFQITKNGIEVCFIRWEDLQWGLRRVEVETGQFENLPVDRYSYNPAWDPQKAWRVIYDGDKGLMQLDVTTNTLWPITTDVRDSGPVFSPDGQQLALTYQQHDHWEVYTFNLEQGNRQRLTKPPLLADPQYSSAAPAWSPDGQQLAFFTDRSGIWQIWVMNADGSNPRPMFDPQQQAQLGLEYHGVNERLLNWIKASPRK